MGFQTGVLIEVKGCLFFGIIDYAGETWNITDCDSTKKNMS